jgi:hypothetical protein
LNFGGIGGFFLSKTKAHIGTAAAGVLRKADATVRQKVPRFYAVDCAFNQVAKLLALFVGYGGAEVLNLDQAFADKYHLGNFRNTRHRRTADKLGIQSKQSLWLF